MNITVSVIIVNYNTGTYISKSIESVLSQKDVDVEIIVVDNASTDNSLEILRTFGNSITLIESDSNLGFGCANNLGFTYANGDYIYLLNPDAYFEDSFGLKNLVMFMKEHLEFGIVGTKIISECEKKTETLPFMSYPEKIEKFMQDQILPGTIAWIIGASMMIPRKIYEEIKGFDEDFFLYGEDNDICLRIRKLGYPIGYCDGVVIIHFGGSSEVSSTWYSVVYKKQKAEYAFLSKHCTKANVKNIALKKFKKALFRKGCLWICKNTIGLDKDSQRKYEKYCAMYDSAHEVLTKT